MNNSVYHTELSSLEETRCQFNGTKADIKSAEGRMRPVCALGIDVHQDFYVVVMQEGGSNPKPPQRFREEAFLHWRLSSPAPEQCMPVTKREGLVFLCSAN